MKSLLPKALADDAGDSGDSGDTLIISPILAGSEKSAGDLVIGNGDDIVDDQSDCITFAQNTTNLTFAAEASLDIQVETVGIDANSEDILIQITVEY